MTLQEVNRARHLIYCLWRRPRGRDMTPAFIKREFYRAPQTTQSCKELSAFPKAVHIARPLKDQNPGFGCGRRDNRACFQYNVRYSSIRADRDSLGSVRNHRRDLVSSDSARECAMPTLVSSGSETNGPEFDCRPVRSAQLRARQGSTSDRPARAKSHRQVPP